MKIAQFAPTKPLTELSADESRRALLKMQRALVNLKTGDISSGYLRLSQAGSLNVGGFLTKGSHAQASGTVRQLVRQAYADKSADSGKLEQLEAAMDRYLAKTGQAMGSRSFVKLVQLIDKELFRDNSTSHPGPNPEQVNASHLKIDGFQPVMSASQVSALRGNSPISDVAAAQFDKLARIMPGKTFGHFKGVMFPQPSALNPLQAVQGADAPRTFAMGDADRMLVDVKVMRLDNPVAGLSVALHRLNHQSRLEHDWVISVDAADQLSLHTQRDIGRSRASDLQALLAEGIDRAQALLSLCEGLSSVPEPSQEGTGQTSVMDPPFMIRG